MSHDMIKQITDAEDSARKARADAQAAAKNAIAEAEKKGQATVAEAIQRADAEVKRLLAEADARAADDAARLREATAKQQADIHRLAGARLDEAAGIIVERIVNG